MPDEIERRNRRWDDSLGVFDLRLVQLERDRADHEDRLRRMENTVQIIQERLTVIGDTLKEMREDSRTAAMTAEETRESMRTESRRNWWTFIIGTAIAIVTIAGTVIATHVFK